MTSWVRMMMAMVVVVSLVSLDQTGGNPLPPSCSGPQPSSQPRCDYSTTKDSCGNTVCLKGPGEMCGGKYSR